MSLLLKGRGEKVEKGCIKHKTWSGGTICASGEGGQLKISGMYKGGNENLHYGDLVVKRGHEIVSSAAR